MYVPTTLVLGTPLVPSTKLPKDPHLLSAALLV